METSIYKLSRIYIVSHPLLLYLIINYSIPFILKQTVADLKNFHFFLDKLLVRFSYQLLDLLLRLPPISQMDGNNFRVSDHVTVI